MRSTSGLRPLAFLLLLVPSVARADSADATARERFNEGRELVNAGSIAQACIKFEESVRLVPGIGNQYHLADCYEREGRFASAWTTFQTVAAAAAAQQQPERRAVAAARAKALEGKIARLTIRTEATIPGLVLSRDGKTMGAADMNTEIAVDIGPHTIAARAPGYQPYEMVVKIPAAANGVVTEIVVPRLTPVEALPAPARMRPVADCSERVAPPPPSLGRTLGYGTGALGIAGIAVGSVFAVLATSNDSASDRHCTNDLCDPTGLGLRDTALSQATAANVAFTVGVVALASAVTIMLLTPSKSGASRASR